MFNENKLGLRITSGQKLVNPDTKQVPDKYEPTAHVFYQERVCDIDDQLPKFLDLPESFGGSNKLWEGNI